MAGKVVVKWVDVNPTGDGFVIYKSSEIFDKTSLPTVHEVVSSDVREYVDTDVVTGDTYYYAVAYKYGDFEIVGNIFSYIAFDDLGGE